MDGTTALGDDHPTSLGDGPLDFVSDAARDNLWGPLGFGVFLQFLLLGCMAGALLGGSQGLARSLFGQMVPETRSAEFFGFFGFFGRVAAILGPLPVRHSHSDVRQQSWDSQHLRPDRHRRGDDEVGRCRRRSPCG